MNDELIGRLRAKSLCTNVFTTALRCGECDACLRHEAADALSRATQPPAGSVGVPREPTREMIEAGNDCYSVAPGTESWTIAGCKGAGQIWSAMLTAAPQPAGGEVG